ncbi:hypothetical protein FPOA_04803 [Fusarium poae]|uniref:Uncharacterized protein n=1 Tax=Fusarium poae TaxID=36050 RepID=A0A1B8AUU1_FUSPO|nr:hypothetical protein FPOA_04803 [Fusarium poae]
MPGCFANPIIRSPISSQTYTPVIPISTFWATDIRGDLVSISGSHQFVGPFFEDLQPVAGPDFDHRPGSIADALQDYCDSGVSKEDFLRQTKERQCMRLNLVKALDDDMKSEVVLAAEKGAIPWVVERETGIPQLLHKSRPAPAPTRPERPLPLS